MHLTPKGDASIDAAGLMRPFGLLLLLTCWVGVNGVAQDPASGDPSQKPLTGRDPLTGTWKLDMSKTVIRNGPPVKSRTVFFIADGPYVYQRMEQVLTDGTASVYESSQQWDGTEEPNKRGLFGATTVARTRLDSHTAETVYRKDGKILVVARHTISQDGKSRTSISSGVDANGRKVDNLLVYEKQ